MLFAIYIENIRVFEHAPPGNGLSRRAMYGKFYRFAFEVWEALCNLPCMLSMSHTKGDPLLPISHYFMHEVETPNTFPYKEAH